VARGVNLARSAPNATGRDPDLDLLTFDDQDDPELGIKRAEEILADKRVVSVIPHGRSIISLAGAPISAKASDSPSRSNRRQFVVTQDGVLATMDFVRWR
jgi:ABC-type branched-subunit amino acid transport system substrate-binding protein